MANNYFQFKQFIINQERAALKVSTDSCLFGAWAGKQVETGKLKVENVLDIGSGTGLLMLMIAQKINAAIDGIEMDEPSFQQANENIAASPWNKKLNLYKGDVKTFSFPHNYDFIICNPPFYEGDLKSVHANKNIAKHDEGLTLDELLDAVNKNLTADGSFALLLPWHRTESFLLKANEQGFYCSHLVKIKQTPNHNYFRSVLLLKRRASQLTSEEIIIKENNGVYSTSFMELLKDYYLYL